MDIEQAKDLLVKTHLAAIVNDRRANSYQLEGKSGTAKSEGVEQACARMARELDEPYGLVTCMAASFMSVDMRGFVFPQKVQGYDWPLALTTLPPWYPTRFNVKVFNPDGTVMEPPLPEGMPIPLFGTLFLDEWGLCEDDIQKAGAPIFISGGVGDVKLQMHWRAISASNRLKDKTGVAKALTLVVNRRGVLPIEGKFSCFEGWVNTLPKQRRPHHLSVSFAAQNAHIVFDDEAPPSNGEAFCTSRSLVRMDEELQALRSDEEIERDLVPQSPVARQVATGWIGGPAAAQFFTHVRYENDMPTMAQIMRDPTAAKLPKTKDAQMVCAYMISHRMEEKQVDKCVQYICRLDRDMQTLFMRQAQSHKEKGPWLTTSDECAKWYAANGDLLVASHG